MKQIVKELIDSISKKQVSVVDDIQTMKEVLMFKKYHCDYEMYNILSFFVTASHLMQLDAVQSLSKWRKHFNDEYLSLKEDVKKPLVALVPIFQNDEIKLMPYKVYDISQIDIDEEKKDIFLENQKSELEKVMREEANKKLIFLCCRRDSNWGFKSVLSYLDKNEFFVNQNDKFKRYIKMWMCVVFEGELSLQRQLIQEKDLTYSEEFEVDKAIVLDYLSDLIGKFHFYFYSFLKNYAKNEIKKLKKEKLEQLENQGITAAVDMITKIDYNMQEMADEIIKLQMLG